MATKNKPGIILGEAHVRISEVFLVDAIRKAHPHLPVTRILQLDWVQEDEVAFVEVDCEPFVKSSDE